MEYVNFSVIADRTKNMPIYTKQQPILMRYSC